MSVNDFEKRVQQKMDELRLTPSAFVWAEVEKKVRMERKRRRVIFWWVLPLLLAGGAIFYFSQRRPAEKTSLAYNQPKPSTTDENTVQEPTTADNSRTETSPAAAVNNNGQTVNTGIGAINNTQTNEPQVKDEVPAPAKAGNTATAARTTIARKTKTGIAKTTKPVVHKEQNETPVFNPSSASPDETVVMNDSHRPVTPAVQPVAENEEVAAMRKPSMANTATPPVKEDAADPFMNPDAKPVVRVKSKPKWETGLVMGLGVGARVEPIFSSSMKMTADQSNAIPLANIPYTAPGELQSRSSFQLGGYARKQLSGRTAFSTGLVYASYSTKQQTGQYIDSILVIWSNRNSGYVRADGFYRSGKSYVFDNRYYMVQVPLTFEWQLNKGKEVAINWENGVTPSVIAGTNSLVYNTTTATYYKDKTAYKRLQLFYNTGLSARFGQDSKHPVTAGINMSYGLTDLHKNKTTQQNKLFSFGVSLKYALKK